MKRKELICQFCGRKHEDVASLDACFVNPVGQYAAGDLLIDEDGILYRISKLDKRKKNLVSDDIEVEKFAWREGAWGYGKAMKMPIGFWCRVRACSKARMRDRIESTRRLLELEEMLLAHMEG